MKSKESSKWINNVSISYIKPNCSRHMCNTYSIYIKKEKKNAGSVEFSSYFVREACHDYHNHIVLLKNFYKNDDCALAALYVLKS